MNLNDFWSGLTGKGGPFAKILRALEELDKDHQKIVHELDEIEHGRTPWQQDTSAQLQAIKLQLNDIEDAVSGTEAAHLIVSMGPVEEQPE